MQITWRIVPYRGNRLLSLPGPVACYRYLVHPSRKLRRVVHNVLPKLSNVFRKRKQYSDDDEAKRLKSRGLFCMNLRELSLSSRDIGERHTDRERQRERERERRKKRRNRGSNEGRRENEKAITPKASVRKRGTKKRGKGLILWETLSALELASRIVPTSSWQIDVADSPPTKVIPAEMDGDRRGKKKRVRRDFAPRMIRSSRTKSISRRLDCALWHTFLCRSNSSSLYVHTYVCTYVRTPRVSVEMLRRVASRIYDYPLTK